MRHGSEGLELRLEQGLVDLPLVDRDALLDTEADDLAALDAQLLRQLVRRQVVRHVAPSSPRKSPSARGANGLVRVACRLRESKGPPPSDAHLDRRIIAAADGRKAARPRGAIRDGA